jgi:SAM-dependent methyltransferase
VRFAAFEGKQKEKIVEIAGQANSEQKALWNGRAGQAWVEAQASLDEMFKPLGEALVEAAQLSPGDRALDVGCGAGATTLAVAQRLGANGHCVGVDLSQPMIAAARARARRESLPASFVCADAQTHAFDPASFDALVSRFGVMFFDDSVQAFANLRRAARSGARLRFVSWRSATENPFMTVAERAAAPLLPNLPARQPDAPGQFGFADPRRVSRILEASGWTRIDVQPIDAECALPESALLSYLTRLGPLGRILSETDRLTRTRVVETVRAAMEPYVRGADVRFVAACWMTGAQAP